MKVDFEEYRIIGTHKIFRAIVIVEEGFVNRSEAEYFLDSYKNEYPEYELEVESY